MVEWKMEKYFAEYEKDDFSSKSQTSVKIEEMQKCGKIVKITKIAKFCSFSPKVRKVALAQAFY